MHDDTGWSHASIFAGLTVHFLCGAVGGLAFGRFTDRPGGASRLQRGRAFGVSMNGGSLSALVMVPLIALLISELGWRDAWLALGVITAVLLLPLVPLAVRAPEDLGLLPDNGVTAGRSGRSRADERSYRLNEIVHTGQFWLLLGGTLIGTYSLQAHTVVMLPHFEDIGFSSTTAASALAMYGVFSVGMRMAWGALADRSGARLAMIIQATLTGFGAFILLQVTDTFTLYAAMAIQGIVLSGYPPLQVLLWPEFFGRLHIGSIVGLTQFFSTVAGAAGPVAAGFLFDQTGSYEAALWMLLGTWLACALVMLTTRPAGQPRLRDANAT
jgi:MFS family permease